MATFTIAGTAATNATITVTVTDSRIVASGKYELQWSSRENPAYLVQDLAPTVGVGTLSGFLSFTGTIATLRPSVLASGYLYLWDLSSTAKNVMLGYTRCPVVHDNPEP
jgi:hypothetical protein